MSHCNHITIFICFQVLYSLSKIYFFIQVINCNFSTFKIFLSSSSSDSNHITYCFYSFFHNAFSIYLHVKKSNFCLLYLYQYKNKCGAVKFLPPHDFLICNIIQLLLRLLLQHSLQRFRYRSCSRLLPCSLHL